MRMTHVVMLVAALVCAGAAALLARTWLVRQSAQAPAQTQTMAPASAKSIVVAARELKYGDKLDAKALKLVPWSSDTIPKGAFLSTDALLSSSEMRVVLSAMAEGEPVLQHKLLGGSSANALSAKLTDNMKAVTIRVNEVAGVAGFVQPEDRVDVFLTYGDKAGPETARQGVSAVVVLLQNVRVLAVDQVTQRRDQATPPKAVTVEVSTADAQKLILAGQGGTLSLALNRTAAPNEVEITGAVVFEDLVDAEKQPKRPSSPGGPTVSITRGTDTKNYQVPPDAGGRDEIITHQILRH